jgi:hypothetical protein
MFDASTDRRPGFLASHPRRWLGPALATILLHVLAWESMSASLQSPTWERPGERVVMASIDTASAMRLIAPPPPAASTRKAPARPAFVRRAVKAAAPSNAIAAEVAAAAPAPGTESADTAAEASVALVNAAPALQPEPQPPTPPAAPETANTFHVSPPPSAELQYDVRKVPREGNPIYGHSRIAWRVDGDRYVIDGEVGVLFITAMTFKSEGMIDEHGVSPVIYSEKRFRRSETATHFQRERNTISFSASEQTYPRQGGEQDRASIVWQLAGIGRGDSAKFVPDAEIDVFVAGIRDGEVWRIHVIGEEEIDTGSGKTKAWHVMRMPRPGSYDQKLDIWLAPESGWYPVKIRYTETNGDYLDMSVSNLKLADSPHSSDARVQAAR